MGCTVWGSWQPGWDMGGDGKTPRGNNRRAAPVSRALTPPTQAAPPSRLLSTCAMLSKDLGPTRPLRDSGIMGKFALSLPYQPPQDHFCGFPWPLDFSSPSRLQRSGQCSTRGHSMTDHLLHTPGISFKGEFSQSPDPWSDSLSLILFPNPSNRCLDTWGPVSYSLPITLRHLSTFLVPFPPKKHCSLPLKPWAPLERHI